MAIWKFRTSTPTTVTPMSCRDCPAAQAGTDTRTVGAQRRRQDHAGELDRRVESSAPRQDLFKGVDITRMPRSRRCGAEWAWSPGPARLSHPERRGEPHGGGAQPRPHGWNLERVYALFPRLRERRGQRARTLRAASSRCSPSAAADDQPGLSDHGRAVRRARAHHHPGVWEAIGRLKQEGMSILLVEQNASLALKLVDYVHVMSKGRVVYSARPEELRANDEIKSSYLGI